MRTTRLFLLLGVCSLVVMRNSSAQDPPPLWEELFLTNITPLEYGAAGWGDFDKDGDFDLIYTGNTAEFDKPRPATAVLRNLGDATRLVGNPTGGEPIALPGIDYGPLAFDDIFDKPVWRSAVAWGDVDGDDRLDVVFTGMTREGDRIVQVYQQTPPETPRRFARTYQLPGLSDGDLVLVDIDNDGDQDIIVSGSDDSETGQTILYENQIQLGNGFIPIPSGIIGLRQSQIAVGDYDNDMDMDVAITGIGDPQEFITRLYRNDGNGNFSQTSDVFKPLLGASLDWGDYDTDGDLDLVYSGGVINSFLLEGKIYVYKNTSGTLSPDGVSIIGAFEGDPAFGRYRGSASWGDYNNDGYLDFLVAGGKRPQQSPAGQVYENRRGDLFTHTTIGNFMGRFPGGQFGTSFWGDYDNDGDLDIFSLGFDEARGDVAIALRNFLPRYPRNNPPSAPSETSAATGGDSVTLSWNAGVDSHTPTSALTYNLRIGTTQGAGDIMPAMAVKESGLRLIAGNGNVQNNLSWKIHSLAPGTYFWAVQAVDTSFKGSPFTEEGSFTIPQ